MGPETPFVILKYAYLIGMLTWLPLVLTWNAITSYFEKKKRRKEINEI
jgi:hypothetical protein